MLHIGNEYIPLCSGTNRRSFLQVGAAAMTGMTLANAGASSLVSVALFGTATSASYAASGQVVWPLFGAPKLRPAQTLHDAIACEDDGVCGVAAEQTLLDRLHVKRGDLIKLGDATFRIMAALDSEPDRISTGFSLGPRMLVAAKSLPATSLVTLESLVNYTSRIALAGAPSDPVQAKARITQFRDLECTGRQSARRRRTACARPSCGRRNDVRTIVADKECTD